MAYVNRWNSTDQIPSRAVASGEIGLYGALDPSDGGNSNRFSLSGRWAQTDEGGSSIANFYVVKSSLDLNNTMQRQFLSPIRSDAVHEDSVGIFAENTLHWTDWLRTIAGWRGDFYDTSVLSYFTPANSGTANAFIGSPKLGLVLGPFAKTEFFVNAGEGFHSNDARGVTITQSPLDGSPLQP